MYAGKEKGLEKGEGKMDFRVRELRDVSVVNVKSDLVRLYL